MGHKYNLEPRTTHYGNFPIPSVPSSNHTASIPSQLCCADIDDISHKVESKGGESRDLNPNHMMTSRLWARIQLGCQIKISYWVFAFSSDFDSNKII